MQFGSSLSGAIALCTQGYALWGVNSLYSQQREVLKAPVRQMLRITRHRCATFAHAE